MDPLQEAIAPMSVTLTLEDELDISRGDMIASAQRLPEVARQFDASVVWLNEQPLDPAKTYVVKHTAQSVAGRSESHKASREYNHAGARAGRAAWK